VLPVNRDPNGKAESAAEMSEQARLALATLDYLSRFNSQNAALAAELARLGYARVEGNTLIITQKGKARAAEIRSREGISRLFQPIDPLDS
jgi:hypothetical protein